MYAKKIYINKGSQTFGEPEGYEEVLYQTEEGKYFLYVNGGTSSKYPKEDLKRLSKEKAENWLKEHA